MPDVKNCFSKYNQTSGVNNIEVNNIKESIEILKNSNIDFEFRTTVVKELHCFEELKQICDYLGPKVKYNLQNYRDCKTVLVSGYHGFEKEELMSIKNELNKNYPNVCVRGI